jgi:hypothetical protein
MRRSMTDNFDHPDSSAFDDGLGIMQAYLGVSLILLGVVLLGVVVRTVMQL